MEEVRDEAGGGDAVEVGNLGGGLAEVDREGGSEGVCVRRLSRRR